MAATNQSKSSNVATLQDATLSKGESLWVDAFRRLRRNYMAMLGIFIIIGFIFTATFAAQLAPKGYEVQVLQDNNAAPQWIIDLFPVMVAQGDAGGYVTVSNEYPLGADELGRDILSRIIYGTRISLAVAFVGPIVALAIGMTLGLSAGFFGGAVDNIIMRVVDLFYAFPTLLLIILMMAYFRGGFSEEPLKPAQYPRLMIISGFQPEEQVTIRLETAEGKTIYNDRHIVRDDGVQNISLRNDDFDIAGDYTLSVIRADKTTITDTFPVIFPEVSSQGSNGVTFEIDSSETAQTEMRVTGLAPNEEVLLKVGIAGDARSTLRGRFTADENGAIVETIDTEKIGVPGDYAFVVEHDDKSEDTGTFTIPDAEELSLTLSDEISAEIGEPIGPTWLDRLSFRLAEVDRGMGGMLFIFIGVGLTSWVGLARLTRGQVLSVRESEYIVAAESIGAKKAKIILRHVLPNILGPIIVAETLTIPTYIRYEAFLSFIGLGVNRPTPSWGSMISDGARSISSYPYQAIFPAIALFLIMFAFNFLGDGLRDALDPRMRGVD